jgi:hypothetical protein
MTHPIWNTPAQLRQYIAQRHGHTLVAGGSVVAWRQARNCLRQLAALTGADRAALERTIAAEVAAA